MEHKNAKKGIDMKQVRGKPKIDKEKAKEVADSDAEFTKIEDEVSHKYQITNQIGAGSYGFVYEAIEKETNKKVAIKSIHSIFDDLVDCKRIMREIKILRRLNCDFAIKLYDVIPPTNRHSFNRLNIVIEYCDSDVKKLLKSALNLEEIHIKTLMYNLLCGLKYLHSARILHRDIKPGNILVNED